MCQCLGSNADRDRVALGPPSKEGSGQEGQSFGLPAEVEDAPGKL